MSVSRVKMVNEFKRKYTLIITDPTAFGTHLIAVFVLLPICDECGVHF
jgi:hypothetical protein